MIARKARLVGCTICLIFGPSLAAHAGAFAERGCAVPDTSRTLCTASAGTPFVHDGAHIVLAATRSYEPRMIVVPGFAPAQGPRSAPPIASPSEARDPWPLAGTAVVTYAAAENASGSSTGLVPAPLWATLSGGMLVVSLAALFATLVIGRRRNAAQEARYRALSESEARFQAVAENMPQMAWMAGSDGTTIWQNRRWLEYTGMEPGTGTWEDFIHPDHVARVSNGMAAAEARQTAFEDTFPIKGKDGTYRWFLSRAVPIRSHDGQALYFGTDTDITESIESADRLKLLMREVDHRAKNMLEIVQSVIAFTDADDVDTFSRSITERIAALGRTQSLLADNNWSHVSLGEAIHAHFAPILDVGHGARISLAGPEVLLKAKPTEALLMALHELATNAMKYGALSVDTGRVNVVWSANEQSGLTLTWREEGGPSICAEPTHRGFGLELIDTMFGGEDHAAFLWHADGLQVTLCIGAEGLARPISEGSQAQPVLSANLTERASMTQTPVSQDLRVLVVEDEKMIARLLIRRLEMAGCTVIGPAHTIAQALSLLETAPKPDAAFVDWNLNGVDANPVLEALEAARIPFCIATGNADADARAKTDLILEKPFTAKDFSEVFAALRAQADAPAA